MSDDAKLQKLKALVGQVIPGDQADNFVQYARMDAFTDEAGEIDQDKVMGHLTAISFARRPPRQAPNWGQGSAAGGPPHIPGDGARAALKKRHGVARDEPNMPTADSRIRPGTAARAALAKRHGKSQQ